MSDFIISCPFCNVTLTCENHECIELLRFQNSRLSAENTKLTKQVSYLVSYIPNLSTFWEYDAEEYKDE